jgi:molecular chaperone IbpA
MAVAGFSKDEIEIFEEEGRLTIKGNIKDDKLDNSSLYHYGGLAQRDFTRNFNIAPNIKITEVTLENGVLSINFLKDVNKNRNQIKIS